MVCFAGTSSAEVVDILGYPLDVASLREPKTPGWVGGDPVVGRLACPPLSRVNLLAQKSEPVMIRKISSSKNATNAIWDFEPRRDLRWWNGDVVKAADIAGFIREHLPDLARTKGVGRWQVPLFKTEVLPNGLVRVTWERAPEFGPYIFNGVSLSRVADRGQNYPSWECVGLYQVELTKGEKFILSPSKSYALKRTSLEFASDRSSPGHRGLAFEMASSQRPVRIKSEQAYDSTCAVSIDLPLVTVLAWNTAAGVTASAEVRKALTHLTPRGELVRTGAAAMGDVLSAPIPRNHPGYDRTTSARPYSLELAAAGFDAAGLKRDKADGPRLSKDGNPLKLEIQTPGESNSLIEKVLADAFSLAGIGLEFSRSKDERRDGVLVGVRLSGPDSDFIRNFHSAAPEAGLFWPLRNPQLDAALEGYSLSLTMEKPDFKLLQRVHKILYELEPVTTLLQHRACVVTYGSGWNRQMTLESRDPDWFRKLVL